MIDPYEVLGLPSDSDDETIRRRYLELVKQYPPGQQGNRFSQIRAAYERLRDLKTRVKYRLFEAGENESIDKVIEELKCLKVRRRVSLRMLLTLVRKG
jgi:curved DNA-binding protein CbpA